VTGTDVPAGDAGRLAFMWACALDVAAAKPGNVSFASAGHGMQASLFMASADAAAAALFEPGQAVGARIEGAMRATLAVAGCNTNLGIVLLAAPLAAAFERLPPSAGPGALRQALAAVLAGLSVDDARAAYRAIAATQPGGLGRVPSHDVADEPTIDLRAAMALAAPRDRVAHQYASGYEDVLGHGLERLEFGRRHASGLGLDGAVAARHAMLGLYLEWLASQPDSHIARRNGHKVAHTVMAQAVPWRDAWRQGRLLEGDAGLAQWDLALKARHHNPGTTADLCVASAMVAVWLDPAAMVDLVPADPLRRHVRTGPAAARW
jgi:triphosphoribosyl-dephospho-CoA synthase